MGQELCQQTNSPSPANEISKFKAESPFEELEESSFNRSATYSRLNMRTSALKKQQSNLSHNVKSRLNQLPSISQEGRSSLAEEPQRRFLEHLNAYYEGELNNGVPNGSGSISFENGDYLEG